MRKRQKKRPLTLLEIMIVIFLIGLIGSVIGYNVKGSLDEGKAFRTEQGAAQIHDILLLEVAKGHDIEQVIANKEAYLASSGLVKDEKKILKDGWGDLYEIYPNRSHSDIVIKSKKLTAYKQRKNARLGPSAIQDDEEKEEDAI